MNKSQVVIRGILPALALFILSGLPLMAWGQTPLPWSGEVSGVHAYIPDLHKPIRGAMINNAPVWLSDDDPNWRAVAIEFNLIQLDINLPYQMQDPNADTIIAILNKASAVGTLPVTHPEIQFTPLVLFGFSASSAGAARTASSPKLSNPNPAKAPQRVAAVIGLNEIDIPPYLPPLSVPHLFLSDPSAGWPKHDIYGSLLTDVEDLTPAVTHDTFARDRATAQGAPLTVISQPGHTHGGFDYGMNQRVDYKFLRVWLEEVLKLRLPAQPPNDTHGNFVQVLMPDWTNYPAWVGRYDVVTGTNTQPWENGERMSRVVVSPRAAAGDSRPYIWLPSQHCAEVWLTYASTGSMPSLTPGKPTIPVNAFTRVNGQDVAASVVAGATPASEMPSTECRAGTELTLMVTFDRAIASANVAIGAGTAAIKGAPAFWSNVMMVNLTGVANSQILKLNLSAITPADKSTTPVNATVTLRRLIGDVNGDGVVDAKDLAEESKSEGKKKGTEYFNPRADLNADGVVDAADIPFIQANYGKRVP